MDSTGSMSPWELPEDEGTCQEGEKSGDCGQQSGGCHGVTEGPGGRKWLPGEPPHFSFWGWS